MSNDVKIGVSANLDPTQAVNGLRKIGDEADNTGRKVAKSGAQSPTQTDPRQQSMLGNVARLRRQMAADATNEAKQYRFVSEAQAKQLALLREIARVKRQINQGDKAAIPKWTGGAPSAWSQPSWNTPTVTMPWQGTSWSAGGIPTAPPQAPTVPPIMPPGRRPEGMTRLGYRLASAAGGAIAGMITGGGGMYGGAGAGIGGLIGMLGGPVGSLIGGQIGGALGGKIDQGTQDEISTSIDLSGIKHALGDASDSFEALRTKVLSASEGLGIAYVESAKFAKQYSELANLQRQDKDALRGELRTAYGLARGFGADPGSGVNFMASMRLTGNVRDEKSAKLLGVQIADALERGGNRSKMEEVLQAISSFTQHAARISLTTPDATSFASMMATGTATRIPGLDPAGAAALLASADTTYRHGGGFGESSKIAIMSSIANRHAGRGLSVFENQAIMEGGLFGTDKSTFGEGSIFRERAMRLKMPELLKHYDAAAGGKNADVKNLDSLLGTLRGQSHTDDEYLAQVKGALGLQSMGQAAAVDLMHKTDPGLTDLAGKLKSAGLDIKDVKASSLGGLAEVAATRDSKVLDDYTKKLWAGKEYKALSDPEKKSLEGSKTFEDRQTALLKILADRERQETVGDKMVNIQSDMRDAFQRISKELLPATVTMKDGILALVEKLAPESEMAKEIAAKREGASAAVLGESNAISVSRNRDALNALYAKRDAAKTETDRRLIDENIAMFERTTGVRGRTTGDKKQGGALLDKWPAPASRTGDGQSMSESDLDPIFKAAAEKYGVPVYVAKAIARKESGMRNIVSAPNKNGTVDRGIMQLNSAYDASRGVTDPLDPKQNIEAGIKLFSDLQKKNGGDLWKAARDYNGSGPAAEKYADDMVKRFEEERVRADPARERVPEVPGKSKESDLAQWKPMPLDLAIRLIDADGNNRGSVSASSAWTRGGRPIPAGGR